MSAAPPSSRSTEASGWVYLALTLQTLISAGTYLAAKRVMVELAWDEVLLMRFAISGVTFVVLLVGRRGALPPLRAVPALLGLGFLAGPLNQGLFFYGLSRSVPAHAALLYALTPVGVYLYARVLGRERPSAFKRLGIGLAFAGVAVLLLGRGLGAVRGPLYGDLFFLVAVAAWAVYTAEGKAWVERVGFFRATAWTMIGAAVWGLPTCLAAVDVRHLLHASAMAWMLLVYVGLFTSVIAYLLWYYGLSRLEASRVAVFSNLQPLATAVAAWLLLTEPITWEIFVGGLLVIGGVRVTQRPEGFTAE